MSAFPIAWHEECLENMRWYHEGTVRALNQAVEAERRSRESFERYQQQIELAKKLGKKSFDSDKFGKKREAKS